MHDEKAHNKWLNKTASVLSGKTAVQMGRDQSANLPRPDLQVMRTRSKTYPKRAPQTAGESGLTYLTLIQLRLPACLPAHCSSVLQLFFEFQLRTSQLNKGFPTNKKCLGTSLFDPELIASNFKPYWHHCGHIIVFWTLSIMSPSSSYIFPVKILLLAWLYVWLFLSFPMTFVCFTACDDILVLTDSTWSMYS